MVNFDKLFSYLEYYCSSHLTAEEKEWLYQYGKVLTYKKGEFISINRFPYAYFICQGLLAKQFWCMDGEKRRILLFGQPNDLLFTVANVYSSTLLEYDVYALRNSVVIRFQIQKLREFKDHTALGNTWIHIAQNRNLRQLRQRSHLTLIPNEVKRYVCFYKRMRQLYHLTTYTEQADYLNISRTSIWRALRGV